MRSALARRAHQAGAGALLATLGVALGFGLVEIGVRALHLVQDRFWEADARCGVRLIAGASGWWTQEAHEFRVPVRINQQGLRDIEHTHEKPPGVTRVLLLGDSFVEALQVPLEETIARQLALHLGFPVEVIGAGVSGYGTASEWMFLQHEGWRYDPDVVMVAFYPGNDVKNNSPSLEDILPPVYDGDGRLQQVRTGAEADAWRARKGWRDRLHAYRLARQLVLEHPELASPLHRLGVVGAGGPRRAPEHGGVPIDYEVFKPDADGEWQDAWDHTLRLLSEMDQSVRAHGKRFVIAVIPSRYQVYPAWWDETLAGHPAMQGRSWDVERPARRIVEWCEAHGVPCVDLTQAFRHAAPGSAPLYFHYDGHWNAAGHELAARTVAEFLRTGHLVPARSH